METYPTVYIGIRLVFAALAAGSMLHGLQAQTPVLNSTLISISPTAYRTQVLPTYVANLSSSTSTQIAYTASTAQSWIQLTGTTSGTTPASLSINLNVAQLAPGTYYGQVTLSAPSANAGGGSISVAITVLPFVAIPSGALFPSATIPTGSGPHAILISDFNGDGKSDIATANQNDNNVTVMLGNGSGGFTAAPGSPFSTVSTSPYALAAGDFNSDGIPDLAVINNASDTVSILTGLGNGGFSSSETLYPTGSFPVGIAVGDFNGDRKLDIAIINSGDATITLYFGNGAGQFTFQRSSTNLLTASPSAIAVGDFNGDGRQDVAITSAANGSVVILLGGLNGFSVAPNSPFIAPSALSGVTVGDWNNDGFLDLALAGTTGSSGANGVPIYLGNGTGTFVAQTPGSAGVPNTQFLSVASGDLDGDGNPDLLLTSTNGGNYFLLGNGAGGFAPGVLIASSPSYGAQIGDFNGDNRSDVAIANFLAAGSITVLNGGADTVSVSLANSGGGNPVYLGSPVTVSATVVPLAGSIVLRQPTGTVSFMHGSTMLGSPALTGNSATVTTTNLSAGNNVISAVYSGDVRTTLASSSTNLSITADTSAATLTISSGSPQTVSTKAQFAPLQVIVKDANSLPIAGFPVNFTAPSSGASGTFAASAMAVTNSQGVATAPTFTANAIGGSFSVTASIASPSLSVNFSLNSVMPVALRFVPVTPCRVADTRTTAGPFGAPSVTGQTTRTFLIPNSACSIPATALAYSLNVTVVPQAGLGYLTVFPAGSSQPLVSTLNSDGRTKANASIVPAGSGGGVSVFASNTTDVVLDIDGYFVTASSSTALSFYPLAPCRIADTRLATGPLGAPYMPGLSTRTYPVQSSTSCNVPSSAQAYSLNFSAIPRTSSLAFITVWPTGQSQPAVSTLNAPTGTVTANAAIVPVGTGGSINVFATQDTDLAIDIDGYFAPAGNPGALSLYTLQPCRVLDTRLTNTTTYSGVLAIPITGSVCGAPSTAQAFALNATVVPAGAFGYLTLWAQGATQPVVSTLNALDGAVTSNLALVPAINGTINAFAPSPTALVLDLFGYFAP